MAFIHGNTTEVAHLSGFDNYHWVDAHVSVVSNTGTRCADIDRLLRFAMTTVMGRVAVNEEKFTPWITRQKVLGLVLTH